MKEEKDQSPQQEQPKEDESIVKEWKPEPVTSAGLGFLGFGMSIGLTNPPQKPDDEPLQ